MRTFPTLALTIFALVAATEVQAQTATAFDGTYNGVSVTASGEGRGCTPWRTSPLPLTISGGVVSWAGGPSGEIPFQGTVSAQGAIQGKGSNGINVHGKIEGGKITIQLIGTTNCITTATWQK